MASEQTRPDVAAAREQFLGTQLKDVPLNKIVVLDETYATTTFTRLRGHCRRDQRLTEHVPGGHWKRLTILGAITADGVLCVSTTEASTDADVFGVFVQDVLVPSLSPGMVVVMDNLSSHKVSGIAGMIESAGCRVVYLPPYSPDMSPIESMGSKLKQVLRTLSARTVAALNASITYALSTLAAQDCRNAFTACGYTLQKR